MSFYLTGRAGVERQLFKSTVIIGSHSSQEHTGK